MKEEMLKYVEKPWGNEKWIAVHDQYALKIITLSKGERTSLQYHNQKEEHIYICSGTLEVEEDNEHNELITTLYGPGDIMFNAVKKRHRLKAIETCEFIEVSTPYLDDVVRVEDDYKRT